MRAAIALASIIAALCITAAPATAGTYDVWSCRLPDGSVAPLDGWRYEGMGAGANQCPHFGFSAGFPRSTVAATATAGWWFEAPQQLSIRGYELYRAARAGVGSDGTHRAYALYHDTPLFEPLVHLFEFCLPSNNCYEQGRPFPGDPMDPANRVARTELNLKNLILRLECRTVTGETRDCGPAEPGGALGIARARISLSDAVPPTLDPPSGSLVTEGAEVEGTAAVQVSAHDEGGGLLRFSVLVDGRIAMEETLEDVAPSCRSPFVKVVPCPGSTARTLGFDTATIPNGKHSIQIAVDDVAGNRTISPAVSITTANGSIPNGSGATGSAQLVAGFVTRSGRADRGRVTVAFNETKAIKGRLVDVEGRPIGFATVDVVAQAQRTGAKARKEGVVETGADGRFRYVPRRRGPSRIIRLEYRAFSLDANPSSVVPLTLRVRAGVRLNVVPRRTTRRGTIRFAGRLLGGPGRAGVQVTLYAVERVGRTRVPVSVLRTDAAGRFRFSYRFVRTFAPFTYRFQARVDVQPTYPYAPAGSNRAVVRVVR